MEPKDPVQEVLKTLRKPIVFCRCGDPFCDGCAAGVEKVLPPLVLDEEEIQ